MTIGDLILFVVVLTMAGNYVVLRLPGWETRAWAFWLLQGLNLGVAIFMMAEGIPALPGNVWIFNWVLGLLFVMRIVQNNSLYAEAWRDRKKGTDTERNARKRELTEALARGQDAEE